MVGLSVLVFSDRMLIERQDAGQRAQKPMEDVVPSSHHVCDFFFVRHIYINGLLDIVA